MPSDLVYIANEMGINSPGKSALSYLTLSSSGTNRKPWGNVNLSFPEVIIYHVNTRASFWSSLGLHAILAGTGTQQRWLLWLVAISWVHSHLWSRVTWWGAHHVLCPQGCSPHSVLWSVDFHSPWSPELAVLCSLPSGTVDHLLGSQSDIQNVLVWALLFEKQGWL